MNTRTHRLTSWLIAIAAAFALSATAFLPTANAAESTILPEPTLAYALDGGFDPSNSQSVAATAISPYRFLKIGGRSGYHPIGLRSHLRIPTDLHTRNAGAIILSVCATAICTSGRATPGWRS